MRKKRHPEDGMATAEFALTLPAVVAVLIALLLTASVGINQAQLTTAARVVARSLAAGEDPSTAKKVGAQVAPTGAVIVINTESGRVSCEVSKNLSPIGDWAPVTVKGQAIIPSEENYE